MSLLNRDAEPAKAGIVMYYSLSVGVMSDECILSGAQPIYYSIVQSLIVRVVHACF